MTTPWRVIASFLVQSSAPLTVRVRKRDAQHPRDGGLLPALALPGSQRATYQLPLAENRALLVQEYAEYYEAHVELRLSPAQRKTPPADSEVIAATTVVGGLVGLFLGKSGAASIVGLLAGAVVGGAVTATASEAVPVMSENATSPATKERTGG